MMLSAIGAQRRAEGLEAGADDYLAKPFEAPELFLASRRCTGALGPRTQRGILTARSKHVKERTAFRQNRTSRSAARS